MILLTVEEVIMLHQKLLAAASGKAGYNEILGWIKKHK